MRRLAGDVYITSFFLYLVLIEMCNVASSKEYIWYCH